MAFVRFFWGGFVLSAGTNRSLISTTLLHRVLRCVTLPGNDLKLNVFSFLVLDF